jgi:hypothetical protein
VFEGALTYPAILFCAASEQEVVSALAMERFEQDAIGRTGDLQLFVRHSEDVSTLPSSAFYSFEVWSTLRACSLSAMSLDAVRADYLGRICNLSSSMKSGLDEILVGRLVSEARGVLQISLDTEPDPLVVNPALWRKVIRPKDLGEDGTIKPESHVVFWPYEEDKDEFVLLSERTIKDMCAAPYEYLRKHKPLLENRRDSRKTWKEHGRPWFSLARIGKPLDYRPPKLLSPGEFVRPRFALCRTASLFPCARIVGASSIGVSVTALRLYLQSSVVEGWFRTNLPAKGGGYRGMAVGDLTRLPVPFAKDSVWKALDATSTEQSVNEIVEDWLGRTLGEG